MKKIGLKFICLIAAAFMCFGILTLSAAAEAAVFTVDIPEENNLASSKYDWNTDGVGTADISFDEGGMLFENFNVGGGNFAVYKTNKVNEFKYSMFAKLNLKSPAALGYKDYPFDASSFYVSFMIDSDNPYPTYACPWVKDTTYFSLCFENLQGHEVAILYLNEVWNSSGATRYGVAESRNITFTDGQYHWYELEVTVDTVSGKTGKRIKVIFDGVTEINYFQPDGSTYTRSKEDYMNVNFSGVNGYIGFWSGSGFGVGVDSDETECYVDIAKMKLVSYDFENPVTFGKAPVPEFPLTIKSFSPAAGYEAGEEIEIKLSELFTYEGDELLSYEVTCEGDSVGAVRNGYFVWTPSESGSFDIDIKASAGNKTVVNYITLRVEKSSNTDINGGGSCGGNLPVSAIIWLMPVAALAVLVNKIFFAAFNKGVK